MLRGPVSAETRIGQDQYQLHALLFFGVAFLGAYLWGLQEIIRRYFANDWSDQ